MSNMIDYKEGVAMPVVVVSDSENWQDKVEIGGKGISKGIEFLLNKKEGKNTGWISYTLSKTTRQFENINSGLPYYYRYDRRHDFSFVWFKKIRENIDFSLTWIFSTGNAITLATSKHLIIGESIQTIEDNNRTELYDGHVYDGGRNNFRMRSYHRMDAGFNIRKDKKWGERTWNISNYNLYNRQNPYFYFYSTGYDGNTKLLQQSFFPFIPSVTYSFKIK
ncbi:MAG: hypothetical protein H0X62_10115 [Bacteroidetes bacterium]|nr:hypothetical protein [Bacteroidota bacterium]